MAYIFKILIISFIGLITLTSAANILSHSAAQNGKRVENLSDKYKVEWEVNSVDETIEFAVTVETTGFVGFGLSLTGSMVRADIVIGGVLPDGKTYFKDYNGGSTNGWPSQDKVQNWELLEGTETAGVTFLRFKRKLDTCDEEDIAITTGTVKIIWSIGETDNIGQHGNTRANRGQLAVNMLDPPLPPLDPGFKTTNFTKSVTLTSDKDTIYWCTMFKRTSTKKSHIVAFEPKFDTEEAKQYTHHFNMYTCKAPEGKDPVEFFDKYTGDHPGHDCFKNVPDSLPRGNCQSNLYAWSLGGRVLVFPEDVGFPWGIDENEYFLFEVHLNNPNKLGGVTFETGITIYDTEVLREKEAGMLSIGATTDPSLMIPPASKDWKAVGHCSSACTAESVGKEGIDIFNVNLHAHLAGRKMKVRQFRDGIELPWIANDVSYDADFQENRPLAETVKLLPGDHISIECSFDSNETAVIGGYATSDEMCMLFAFYYPKSKLENCFSGYPNAELYKQFGIESVKLEYEGSQDPTIVLPEKWAGRRYSDILNNEITWTNELRTSLQHDLLNKDHNDYCRTDITKKPVLFGVAHTILKESNNDEELSYPTVNYPEVCEEYEEPSRCTAVTAGERNPRNTCGTGGTDSTTHFKITVGLLVTLLSTILLH